MLQPLRAGRAAAAVAVAGAALVAASPAAPAPDAISARQLWAALPDSSVVQRQFGGRYWAVPPTVRPASQYASPGELLWVFADYQPAVSNPSTRPPVLASLTLFDTDAHAAAGFAERVDRAAKDGQGTELTPAGVGADSVRKFAFANQGTVDTAVFFRVGRIVGVSERYARGRAEAGTIEAVARSAATRSRKLLAGTLAALPDDPLLAELPAKLGPLRLLGSATLPVESWAITDSSGRPGKVLGELHGYGQKRLPYASYAYAGRPGVAFNVMFFPMRDAAAARAWVQLWLRGTESWTLLRAGKTGPNAIFERHPYGAGSGLELAFAAGKTAIAIACLDGRKPAPGGCTGATRSLGERLYAGLAPKAKKS